MNPNAPFLPGGGPQGMPWGPYVQHDTWWQSGFHVLPLLAFAILIGVLAWGVLRLTSQGVLTSARAGSRPARPAPRDQAQDPAMQALRVRYARGELDRNDFLERSADLGGPPTLPEEPPAADQE